jgi:hypothetical protein
MAYLSVDIVIFLLVLLEMCDSLTVCNISVLLILE